MHLTGLAHGLCSERSGSEAVQALAPETKVVKAFSIYGYENLEDSAYPGDDTRPAMLYCGDGLVQALHLEHVTLLWVRMVRAYGRSPGLVWG